MRNKFRRIRFEGGSAWIIAATLVVCCQLVKPDFIGAQGLQTVTMAIPAKSFQMVIYPLVKERGFMKEEGIDLRVNYIAPVTSIQAMLISIWDREIN